MVATHGGPAGDVFLHIARLFDRTGYRDRIQVDPRAGPCVCRTSTASYPVALLPSHRSYIDPVVLASVLQRAELPPTYKLGGINVAFWPMGPMGRRAGLIFIRRSFRDDPVYKLALREYVGWLAEHRQNLEWYIEGGRTRTGKLRDPRLGLLAYLVDAVHDEPLRRLRAPTGVDRLRRAARRRGARALGPGRGQGTRVARAGS